MKKNGLEEPRLDVSIYLLKPTYINIAKTTLKDKGDAHPLAAFPEGAFIAMPAEPEPPRWFPFVETLLATPAAVNLEAQTPSGLLWIPRVVAGQTRVFVLSFGHAHTRLHDDWLEPQFGKMVALATVPQGQVVEVRAEQVFARRHIASERAPRASAVRDFGFEPDRDLVSAAEGRPSPNYLPLLGGRVRGGTSLRIGLLFSKLGETLDSIFERFASADHKTNWPEAFQFTEIRDEAKKVALDALLDVVLSGNDASKHIALAAPSERTGDVTQPSHVVIGRMGKNVVTSPYLMFGRWQSHLTKLGLPRTVASANETPVRFLDEGKEEIGKTNFYRCMGAEVSDQGRPYILSSGTWWESTQNFIDSTNKTLSLLNAPAVQLMAWDRVCHEGPYNELACGANNDLWHFDKVMVHYGGGQSKFEFCDMMHMGSRTLYFVKNPTQSSGMSHLCEQVRRTAQNLFMPDNAFRTKLSQVIQANEPWDVTWLVDRPSRQDWNLCLVLMGKTPDQLPFFGKCGLARLLRELDGTGCNVSLQTV